MRAHTYSNIVYQSLVEGSTMRIMNCPITGHGQPDKPSRSEILITARFLVCCSNFTPKQWCLGSVHHFSRDLIMSSKGISISVPWNNTVRVVNPIYLSNPLPSSSQVWASLKFIKITPWKILSVKRWSQKRRNRTDRSFPRNSSLVLYHRYDNEKSRRKKSQGSFPFESWDMHLF